MAARAMLAIIIALLLIVNSALAADGSENGDVRAPFEDTINRNRSRLPQLQAPHECQSDIGTSNLESIEILFSTGERKFLIPIGLEVTRRRSDGVQEALLVYMERKGVKWNTNLQRIHLEDKARVQNPYGIVWLHAVKNKNVQVRSIDVQGPSSGPSACTITELVKDSDHNIIRVLARSRPDELYVGESRAPASVPGNSD